ncbi:MAG: transposase [Candidatus Methylomirabilales bacterium]
MKEHKRRWTAETKLSLIKEVQTSGSVVETCKKFGVDPSMYYKWKRTYESQGLEGLERKFSKSDPEFRRLQAENEKLKKLLAEKELAISMLQEVVKKTKHNQR